MSRIVLKIRPQTAEEAFLYIKNLFKKRKFYKKNRYVIDIPEDLIFTAVFNDSDETFEEKENELRKIFAEEIYPKLDFSAALIECEKIKATAVERIIEISARQGFNLLNKYAVVLTAYGPGGSYDFRGVIVIKINSQKSFLDRIIHEAVHIGVEHEVLEKNLSHAEKEKLVEKICQNK